MKSDKELLLIGLSDHTQVMHLALESPNLPFEERLIYLGHLGMCARLFRSICLNDPLDSMEPIIRIEQSSFRYGTPSDQRGNLAKQSWALFESSLLRYLNEQAQASPS